MYLLLKPCITDCISIHIAIRNAIAKTLLMLIHGMTTFIQKRKPLYTWFPLFIVTATGTAIRSRNWMFLFHMLDQCCFAYKAFAAVFSWTSIRLFASMNASKKAWQSIWCYYCIYTITYRCRARELLSLNRLLHVGYSHTCGFSPVCVLMCTVKADRFCIYKTSMYEHRFGSATFAFSTHIPE